MNNETQLSISVVKGGFILTTETGEVAARSYQTEVFTSQGKLMKAVRTLLEGDSAEPKDVNAPPYNGAD